MVTRTLAALVLCGAAFTALGQNPGTPANKDARVGVPLWPAGSPAVHGSSPADIPIITAYLPSANPTKTAIIVAPGGSYAHLSLQNEGSNPAVWLASRGIAAFVLTYRLGPKYHHPVELQDAQRALRTLRAHARDFGIQKDHIGMWGFSAGGHLAATAGTHFDDGNPAAADPIERESSRLNFLILAYPVITFSPAYAHPGSMRNLLGEHPTPESVALLSNETQVTAQTPPTFLFATSDDPVVPVMNSVLFYSALVEHHVPAELHLFRHGKHGVGLAQDDSDLNAWPLLLQHWLVANGWADAHVVSSVLPAP